MDINVEWLLSLLTHHYDESNTFFHIIEQELFLTDLVFPPSYQDLENIIRQTAGILQNSHLNDAIITFQQGSKYETLAKANSLLIYNCIVWLYVVEKTILLISSDKLLQSALTDKWVQKEASSSFMGYKTASKYMKLFKNDYNVDSIAMNMNLMETTLTNLVNANFSSVYNGLRLMQKTTDPTQNWIDTYWILSLAFACKHTLNLGVICALLIPSLIQSRGNEWLERRLLLLKMVDALSIDIHDVSNANYWDLDEVEAHLQRHLKLTSRKMFNSKNSVSI